MSVSRESHFRVAAKCWLSICAGALLLSLVRCTPAQSDAFRCKLGALEELPDDPAEVNVSDVVQVVEHIRACKAKTDAGR